MSKKRGRPPKFVIDPKTKHPVVGLSMDSNCYYYSFWRHERFKKRPNFGPAGVENFKEAYKRFNQFLITHKGGHFTHYGVDDYPPNPTSEKTPIGTTIVKWDEIVGEDNELEPEVVKIVYDEITGKRGYLLRDDFKYRIIGDEIKKNPKLVAQETGIEELGYLDKLLPPRKRLSLVRVGEMYQRKQYNKRGQVISKKTKNLRNVIK